jgi:hypothetical protein
VEEEGAKEKHRAQSEAREVWRNAAAAGALSADAVANEAARREAATTTGSKPGISVAEEPTMPQQAEAISGEHAAQEEEEPCELLEVESRLADAQRRTANALERVAKRLEEAQARVSNAEAHAARAERLAKLKADETEREPRLYRMLDRIAQTEHSAADAEPDRPSLPAASRSRRARPSMKVDAGEREAPVSGCLHVHLHDRRRPVGTQ